MGIGLGTLFREALEEYSRDDDIRRELCGKSNSKIHSDGPSGWFRSLLGYYSLGTPISALCTNLKVLHSLKRNGTP